MSGNSKIRVGSRKSELALIQTKHVISLLKEIHKDKEFEIVTMSTLGDKVLDIPLPKIGEKSLFTKELETALANGNVDFVVHSLKDLPTTLPDGMAIGAVLEREDPRDALVLQKDLKDLDLTSLPEGSVIGTSSLRRTAQLSRKYPHLKVEDIRGNLNTRLRKLDDLGKFQAIILATAGLQRMGWDKRITKVLETDELLYAIGQGALAVECREDDAQIINLLKPLYDSETALRVITERTFLRTLQGGCSAPVAISTEITNVQGTKHKIVATGAVWSLDGKEEIIEEADAILDLKRHEKCNGCPYNNEITAKSSCTKEYCTKTDIECLKGCSFKNTTEEGDYDNPFKRLKRDNSPKKDEKDDIPLDLLKTDPHEHCPVSLPVGADFMGKCPYLETYHNIKHINIDIAKAGGSLDIKKCPFFKDALGSADNLTKSAGTSKNTELYCGLVPHSNLLTDTMEKALNLGFDLAQMLIKKGALDVMSTAQAHIRNS